MRAVITGATRGIGAALLAALRARGDAATGTTRADPAPEGMVTLDAADPASPARAAAAVGGRIDLLVCNAGIYPDKGQEIDTGYPAAMWAEGFATNVTGVFLTVQAFLPLMDAGGRIAIISSQMGSAMRAGGNALIYRATKAAATNLGRNLAVALAPRGIAVGVYHPGWVRTDMGGEEADISVAESAAGLIARFDALGPATTGVFETWDGRAHPF